MPVQADTQSALRAMDEEFVRNANRKDAAALVAGFYAEDATLLPPNAPMISGAAAIRDFWTSVINAGAADVSLNTTKLEVSGDLAYGIGNYSFTLPAATGERTRDDGSYMVVYRRQPDGSWKVVADMFSSDKPAG